jgi:hypothetical protein
MSTDRVIRLCVIKDMPEKFAQILADHVKDYFSDGTDSTDTLT